MTSNDNTPISIDIDSPAQNAAPSLPKAPTPAPSQSTQPPKPTALEDPVAYLENALADFKHNLPSSAPQPQHISNPQMFNSLDEGHPLKPSLTLEDVHSKPEPEFILSPDDNIHGHLPPNEELDFSLLIDESSFNDQDQEQDEESGENVSSKKMNVETPELINGMNPSPESVNDELKSPKDASASGRQKTSNSQTSNAAQEWLAGSATDQYDAMIDNNFGANWLLQDEQIS